MYAPYYDAAGGCRLFVDVLVVAGVSVLTLVQQQLFWKTFVIGFPTFLYIGSNQIIISTSRGTSARLSVTTITKIRPLHHWLSAGKAPCMFPA